VAATRRGISPATEAALWALSNGRCYAPGCPAPVVVEVRPGAYRKNAQIAHIRGVRAPRHDPGLSEEACASFSNLLILCLPHHGEVDDRKTGEALYPAELLAQWKADHEGANGPALAALGRIDDEILDRLLTRVFSPPARRLEQIADQLERTGRLTDSTLVQLRQVVRVMNAEPSRKTGDVAEMLAYAAGVFSRNNFREQVAQLGRAADALSSRQMAEQVTELRSLTEDLKTVAARILKYGGAR
jgi:hypothetical protein